MLAYMLATMFQNQGINPTTIRIIAGVIFLILVIIIIVRRKKMASRRKPMP